MGIKEEAVVIENIPEPVDEKLIDGEQVTLEVVH